MCSRTSYLWVLGEYFGCNTVVLWAKVFCGSGQKVAKVIRAVFVVSTQICDVLCSLLSHSDVFIPLWQMLEVAVAPAVGGAVEVEGLAGNEDGDLYAFIEDVEHSLRLCGVVVDGL